MKLESFITIWSLKNHTLGETFFCTSSKAKKIPILGHLKTTLSINSFNFHYESNMLFLYDECVGHKWFRKISLNEL